MNQEMYATALEKAKDSVQQKKIAPTPVRFDAIRVSLLAQKAFWFTSGVKRKLMRRFGK